MAIDTGLRDIIIVGDFNYNTLNAQSNRKVASICSQFALTQCITSPTHFTEHSESIIDLLLVSNTDSIAISGVGDPFLPQETRFHCPIFGLLKFSKPKVKPFKRKIWLYELGDYDMFRRDASSVNWDELKSENIEEYANNVINTINTYAEIHIPNKEILVRQSDLPWITTNVKRLIRKRKRLYRKAKLRNDNSHWLKFRKFVMSLLAT